MTTRDTTEGIRALLSALPRNPDIIIGNEDEVRYTTGKENEEAFRNFYPNSRIAIMTQGAKGALIRFEGEMLGIPAIPVIQKDEMGAGDAFCGAFLASLDVKPYKDWNRTDVKNAGYFAAHAGSLVVTSDDSRLSSRNISQLREIKTKQKAIV